MVGHSRFQRFMVASLPPYALKETQCTDLQLLFLLRCHFEPMTMSAHTPIACKFIRVFSLLSFWMTLTLGGTSAVAQEVDDRGAVDRMMQDLSRAEQPVDAQRNQETEPTFPINAFIVVGNSLFSQERVAEVLVPFGGERKTADDVEKARAALETLFHEAGYPTVMVSIPQQVVENGTVTLEVSEWSIGNVRVTGNRYFRSERILKRVPAFAPGELIWVPRIQEQLNKANSQGNMKITPSIAPGSESETVDVELAVEDKFPMHGSIELSNRASADTSELRLNGLIRYDNLWQRDHSISLQYQTSPLDTEEVQVIATSYVMPNPWMDEHSIAMYALWTDSASAFGQGFSTVGEGTLVGFRYVMPLPSYKKYSHSITLGVDYKDFEDTLGFGAGGDATDSTPVKYLPVSLAYSASIPDSSGVTQFSGGINVAFRGLVTQPDQFERKRFQARGNYIYATAGVERIQKLPSDWSLYMKVDGQMSDQPLISNEQYSAGGMESVRGYLESEVLGDDALHSSFELNAPDIAKFLKLGDKVMVRAAPYVFYDLASLWIQEELPAQDDEFFMNGVGLGVRGNVTRFFDYDLCWAVALSEVDHTEAGENRLYFRVKFQF